MNARHVRCTTSLFTDDLPFLALWLQTTEPRFHWGVKVQDNYEIITLLKRPQGRVSVVHEKLRCVAALSELPPSCLSLFSCRVINVPTAASVCASAAA